MSRLLYVDVLGGAAGDMLLAALVDAGAPLSAVQESVDAVFPGRYGITFEDVERAGLRARLLRVEPRQEDATRERDAPSSGRTNPRRFLALVELLERASLSERVRALARAVLDRLGEAESRVHDVDADTLVLHELGDDDTLIDAVGVSAALDSLDVDRVLVSDIPLAAGARGDPSHPHGRTVHPAAATLELLTGFTIREGGTGETVTPTGAAILSALALPAPGLPDMTLQAVGYGAGTRTSDEYPNVVRVLLGHAAGSSAGPGQSSSGGVLHRPVAVLEANLDDMTPELVADAVQAFLAEGALDAWTTPIQMKKGRHGVTLSVLCDLADEPRLRNEFFRHTSTFGVRSYSVERAELDRRIVTVPLRGGTVRVKIGFIDGAIMTATPEHDDVASLAKSMGRPVRAIYEEAAAAAKDLL